MEDEEPLATRMLPHPGGWMEPVTLDLAYWKAFDWLVRQPDLSIAKFMKDAEELRGPRDFNQALESYLEIIEEFPNACATGLGLS